MNCVVAPPGDHTFPVELLENKVTLPPWQKVVGPKGVITGAGNAVTVTVVVADVPLQPFASTTVTE